jgi:heat shock protein HslJ
MHNKPAGRFLAAALLLSLAACGPQSDETSAADSSSMTDDTAKAAPELAGSSWQLVQILSMDDTDVVPDDGAKYTLTFTDDGVNILADCNRGTGAYTSQSPGQLTFGMIASTRALCAPDSISDTFMKQFQWVRSYVFKDGNLFLATMADGAIIEFEPLPE